MLPGSGGLYIVWVGLRRDGSLYGRKRDLAAGMAAVIARYVCYVTQDIGPVRTIGAHSKDSRAARGPVTPTRNPRDRQHNAGCW